MATAGFINILAVGVLIFVPEVLTQMGPLNLDILKAGPCDGDDSGIIDMEVISIDENQKGVNSVFDIPWDLDPSISYSVVVDKIANGEVQKDVFLHNGAYFCQDMEKFLGDIWVKLAKAAGMPDECPKAKGTYTLENHPLDYDDIKVEKFLYGRFRMNVHILKDGQEATCVFFEFTNTPPGEGSR